MTGWALGRCVLKVVCQFKTFRLINIMHTLFNIWLLNKVLKRDSCSEMQKNFLAYPG